MGENLSQSHMNKFTCRDQEASIPIAPALLQPWIIHVMRQVERHSACSSMVQAAGHSMTLRTVLQTATSKHLCVLL